MNRLEDYREVAPQGAVDFLRRLAQPLQGKKILHINSTRLGGGVAEILRSLVPLLQDVGLEVQWEVITGNEEFFINSGYWSKVSQPVSLIPLFWTSDSLKTRWKIKGFPPALLIHPNFQSLQP